MQGPARHDRRQSDSRRQGAADRRGAIERERRGARQRAIRRRRRFHRLQDPTQERTQHAARLVQRSFPAATWRAPITAGSAPSAESVRFLIAGGALPLQRRLRHGGRLRFAAAVQLAEEAADVFQNQIARRRRRDQRRESTPEAGARSRTASSRNHHYRRPRQTPQHHPRAQKKLLVVDQSRAYPDRPKRARSPAAAEFAVPHKARSHPVGSLAPT